MQQPITFEIELIRQVEINIDYILMLVMKYHESNCKDKSILGTIDRAIDSSIQLRSKKDLIHGFISTVNAATDVDRDWQSYVQQQKMAVQTGIGRTGSAHSPEEWQAGTAEVLQRPPG